MIKFIEDSTFYRKFGESFTGRQNFYKLCLNKISWTWTTVSSMYWILNHKSRLDTNSKNGEKLNFEKKLKLASSKIRDFIEVRLQYNSQYRSQWHIYRHFFHQKLIKKTISSKTWYPTIIYHWKNVAITPLYRYLTMLIQLDVPPLKSLPALPNIPSIHFTVSSVRYFLVSSYSMP